MKISPLDNYESTATIKSRNELNEGNGMLRHRIRYIVLILTTICLTLCMCNATALHFTVICMKCQGTKCHGNTTNSASDIFTNHTISTELRPLFSFRQESWLFSSLYLGTLLCSLVTDYFCNLLGMRNFGTILGLTCGLATLGTPMGAFWLPEPANFYAVLLARFVSGFSLALSFVVANKFRDWSALEESTLFIGIISTHFTLARTIIMELAAILCESSLGWPSVYYIFGSLTIGFFLLFFWFFRDSPKEHWKVTPTELAQIQFGKAKENEPEQQENAHNRKYVELFKNPLILSLFFTCIGMMIGNQVMVQFGPTYLKKAVGLSTRRIGFVAAMPYLLSAIVATIVGRAFDKLKCLQGKIKLVLILSTSFTQYSMVICYLILSFLPTSAVILIQLFYVVTIMFVGIWVVGTVKHVQYLAKSRAQTLISINTAVWYFYVMLIPTFVNFFISENDVTNISQWNRLFLVVAASQAICGIFSQISIHFMKN